MIPYPSPGNGGGIFKRSKNMIDTCTVIDIAGDYAIIRYDSTGAEGQVALALLPEGLNVGDRLRREFFDYEKI